MRSEAYSSEVFGVMQDDYKQIIIPLAYNILESLLFGELINPVNKCNLERRKKCLRKAREKCFRLIDMINKELNKQW